MTKYMLPIIIYILLSISACNPTKSENVSKTGHFSGLENDAAKTVVAFHKAINSGDADRVRMLLDEAVLIFEGGGVERSAEEYAAHHLKADIAFLLKLKVTSIEHQVQGSSDMAVSMSRSKLVGKYKDKDIDLNTMETIVLRKSNNQWRIIHIHWSN